MQRADGRRAVLEGRAREGAARRRARGRGERARRRGGCLVIAIVAVWIAGYGLGWFGRGAARSTSGSLTADGSADRQGEAARREVSRDPPRESSRGVSFRVPTATPAIVAKRARARVVWRIFSRESPRRASPRRFVSTRATPNARATPPRTAPWTVPPVRSRRVRPPFVPSTRRRFSRAFEGS